MNDKKNEFRILLIEDNVFDVKLVSLYLNENEDYFFEIVNATDLGVGLDLVHRDQYDVVLLDLSLPDSSGINTIKTFLTESPDSTVIVLTGYDDMNVALEALEYGAADYVVKSDIERGLLKKSILYAYHSRKNEDLTKAKELAEKTAEMKHRFLAQMSHELRTPLNVINGITGLLEKTDPNPKQMEYILTLKQSTKHLLSLINEILDYSKLESGKMQLEKVKVNLNKLTRDLINTHKYKAIEKKLNLYNQMDLETPEFIITDEKRLHQLLTILLDNAIKYTDTGEIILGTECIHRDDLHTLVRFYVKDTGRGIDDKYQDSVFESFTQAHRSSTTTEAGTGLGLAIGKEIALLFGSELALKSKLGEGSEFSFIIHAGLNEVEEMQNFSPIFDEMIAGAKDIYAKILLAEDHFLNQFVIKEMLAHAMPGINLHIANNGLEALECLKNEKFDLILMDISMPELDGYDTTRTLRSMIGNPNSNIPILALSAHSLKPEIERCFQVGMNDFVSKPIVEKDLISKMVKHLRQVIEPSLTLEILDSDVKINLSYLDHLANGNADLRKEMIEKLSIEFANDLNDLIDHYHKSYIRAYYQKAHKLKTTMAYLGLKEHPIVIKTLMTKTDSVNSFPFSHEEIMQFNNICEMAISELKKM